MMIGKCGAEAEGYVKGVGKMDDRGVGTRQRLVDEEGTRDLRQIKREERTGGWWRTVWGE